MSDVDVLLPVRNGAATLHEALASVRAQSFPRFRCLVLDDGSTDDTLAIASAVASEDPRFEVVSLPARGIVATLNHGIERARAPFVARLDADDIMRPERLAVQLERLHPGTADVVSSRVRFFGTSVSDNLRAYEDWLNSLLDHEAIVQDLFVESPLPHPSVTMRTDLLRRLEGYRDLSHPEDYDLWLRAWRAGARFEKVPEVLVEIRDHSGRLTKSDPRYTARAFLDCKTEHLVAAHSLRGRDVIVCGAGRDGKRAAQSLRRRGVILKAFVDVAQTKIGRSLLGVEILPYRTLLPKTDAFLVAAVGLKGARAEIRDTLDTWGYREGTEYVCLG